MSFYESEKRTDLIECPFCGEKTVLARVETTCRFVSEHPMYKDGVDMDGATLGQMIGKIKRTPDMEYTGFRCNSCGRDWLYEYAPEMDKNGVISFVKQEKKNTRKGVSTK